MRKNKFISFALIFSMLAVMIPSGLPVFGASDLGNNIFDVSEGDITIEAGSSADTLKVTYGASQVKDDIPKADPITITGTTTTNKVMVVDVTANVTLDNVSIQESVDSKCAFSLNYGGAPNVVLTLVGNNVLKSGKYVPGLKVGFNATLTLQGTGSLHTTGGLYSAGIGDRNSGGNITIAGGTVTAIGGTNAAGIGGGLDSDGTAGGKVIAITGGTITAQAGQSHLPSFSDGGAGIGGGYNGSGGTIHISGGTVTAIGSNDGAGIGGGSEGAGGTINISGGTVVAQGSNVSSGIGSGSLGTGGTVTIDSTATVIATSNYTNYPAIYTASGNLEGASTARVLMATYTAVNSANTNTSVYTKSPFALLQGYAPTTTYRSIAFTVPSDGTYQLKTAGGLQTHTSGGSSDFVIAGTGITKFNSVAGPSAAYDSNAFGKVQAFLNQASGEPGKTNGQALNPSYDENDPATWTDVEWDYSTPKQLTSIGRMGEWYYKKLKGVLDLSNIPTLTGLDCKENLVTSIDVSNCTSLGALNCEENKITNLNLTGLPSLLQLECSSNLMTSLDASSCTSLKRLVCNYTDVAILNVSGLSNLETLMCSNTYLTSLDVSGLSSLKTLNCRFSRLTSIIGLKDITNIAEFYCTFNKLPSLSMRVNGKVIELNSTGSGYVEANYEATSPNSLDLVALPKTNFTLKNWTSGGSQIATSMGYNLDLSTVASGYTLTANFNENQGEPTEILTGVAPTSALNDGKITGATTAMEYKLSTDSTWVAVTGIEIDHLTAGTYDVRYASKAGYNSGTSKSITVPAYVPIITYDSNAFNKVQAFLNQPSAVSGKTNGQVNNASYDPNDPVTWSGVTWDNASPKQLTIITFISHYKELKGNLDLSGITSLKSIMCQGNQLTSVNVSGCTALDSLDCKNNQLTNLNMTGCTSLTGLYCYTNQLTSLNVSGLSSLEFFKCSDNQLTSLDVKDSVSLIELYCDNNQLTSLNVSQCTLLQILECNNNQLPSLDVSKCPSLLNLICNNNLLTGLNVKDCSFLMMLICNDNQLTSLAVSGLSNLQAMDCSHNQLTSLDLSGLSSLLGVDCKNNKLTGLTGLTETNTMSVFDCSSNKLTSTVIKVNGKVINVNSTGSGYIELTYDASSALDTLNITAVPQGTATFIEWASGVSQVSTAASYALDFSSLTSGYTITGKFTQDPTLDPTQDNLDIASAKAVIESGTYTATQIQAPNASAALTKAQALVNVLPLNGTTGTVVAGTFTAATTGTVTSPGGINGNFTFTVTIDKGLGTQVTSAMQTMAIIATAYVNPSNGGGSSSGGGSDSGGSSSGGSSGSNGSTSGSGSSSGGSSTSTSVTSVIQPVTGANILVNKEVVQAGIVADAKVGERTVTTITIDEKKLDQKLVAEGDKATVTVPVQSDSDVVICELNGQMVKNMENKQIVVAVKTDAAIYTLPAQQINIDAVSRQLGTAVELKDIKVAIEIVKPAQETMKVVENSEKTGKFTVMAPPVEFNITCSYKGKSISVNKFNAYVERTIAVPESVDKGKITTSVIIDPDGTVRHVPTQVIIIDGKYYAKINSLTNSTYAIIWNPIEFKDTANHWAKTEVNDMGSRKVIGGVGNDKFDPNREITRAEFAAIVVRGLGLKPSTNANRFADVSSKEWYSSYVQTAYEYGILSGYGDGNFGPLDKITREQAMTMIERAMKITGLHEEFKANEVEKLLATFKDSDESSTWSKNSMAVCIKAGIISGNSESKLAPKDKITRAEVAVLVRRLLQKSKLI